MIRIFLASWMFLTAVTGQAADINALYNASCATCHAVGVLGAPKTGDRAAWAPRVKQGMGVMLGRVKNGYKNMPARGLCNNCTDSDYEALIIKMSN